MAAKQGFLGILKLGLFALFAAPASAAASSSAAEFFRLDRFTEFYAANQVSLDLLVLLLFFIVLSAALLTKPMERTVHGKEAALAIGVALAIALFLFMELFRLSLIKLGPAGLVIFYALFAGFLYKALRELAAFDRLPAGFLSYFLPFFMAINAPPLQLFLSQKLFWLYVGLTAAAWLAGLGMLIYLAKEIYLAKKAKAASANKYFGW